MCQCVVLFSPLFMEMIQFDEHIFQMVVGSTTNSKILGKIRLEDSGIDAGVG